MSLMVARFQGEMRENFIILRFHLSRVEKKTVREKRVFAACTHGNDDGKQFKQFSFNSLHEMSIDVSRI